MMVTLDEAVQDEPGREPIRFVVISDIHVHPWKRHATGTGRHNDRMQRTLEVLGRSLRDAKERADGLWICAGDLIHTTGQVRNEVLNAVADTLSQYPEVHKLLIFGNHDSRSRGASSVERSETALQTLCDAVPKARLLHREVSRLQFTDRELCIYGEGAQTRTKNLQIDPPRPASVGVFHQLVDGSLTPRGRELDGEVSRSDLMGPFDLTIVGDVHHPQYERTDEGLFLVPGAPEQHNFGDEGDERGWWIVEMGEEINLEFVESGSPRFITVEDPDDIPSGDYYPRVKGGTVSEDEVPDGVEVLGSPPTTVEQRDVLRGGSGIEDALSAWMDEVEPDGDRAEYLEKGLELLEEADHVVPRSSRLRRVRGEDFGPYRSFDLELPEGVTVIVGDSQDYDSNGAGKSTLVDAIYYTLFGKTTKGLSAGGEIRDERAGDGASSCRVALDIDLEGTPVQVKRGRDPQGPTVLAEVDGEEVAGSSVREITDRIGGALGVSPDLFQALAYYSQLDPFRLSESTDAERKEILSELCGFQAYERASSEARSMANQFGEEIERQETRLSDARTDLSEAEDRLEQKQVEAETWEQERKEKLKEVVEKLESLREARPEGEERVSGIESRAEDLLALWKQRRDDQREQIKEELVEDRRRTLKRRRAEAEPAVSGAKESRARELTAQMEDVKAALSEARSHLEEAVSSRSEAQAGLRQAKKELCRAEEELDQAEAMEPGDTCPQCGQALDPDHVEEVRDKAAGEVGAVASDVEEWKDLLSEREERADEVREKVESLQDRLDKCESAERFLERLEARHEKVREIDDDLAAVESQAGDLADERVESLLERDRSRISSWVERARRVVKSRIQEWKAQVSSLEDRVRQIKHRTNPHDSAVDELINRVDSLQERAATLKGEIETAKPQKRLYEYWADGLSKRGVQGLLLEEVAAEFNRTRTEVFPLLTDGRFDVQFSTTSETQGGEERERTEFVVRDHGLEVSYDSLSGGERRRVDLGVMLCLALATSRMHSIPGLLGLQVYDEVFGFLDDEGAEAVVSVLEEMTDVIPSILVITQDTEMRTHFDQVIEVREDEDGISRIVD